MVLLETQGVDHMPPFGDSRNKKEIEGEGRHNILWIVTRRVRCGN